MNEKALANFPKYFSTTLIDGITKTTTTATTSKNNKNPRLRSYVLPLGIEIESETWENPKLDETYWEITNDGSLRGDHAAEAVSRPVMGEDIVKALRNYADATADKDPFTFRCSTHFHLGVLYLGLPSFRGLGALTIMSDNMMYALGNIDRCRNYNCRPYSLAVQAVDRLTQAVLALESENFPRLLYVLKEHERYTGTNWCSLVKHGTVEFRHFPGMKDFDQLLRTANAVLSIGEYAANNSYDDILDLIELGPHEFGREVFGNELWQYIVYDTIEQDWYESKELLGFYAQTLQSDGSIRTLDTLLREGYLIQGD